MGVCGGFELYVNVHPGFFSDFKLWSKDHVCAFLHQIGLGSYANNCRKWLSSGLELVEASKKEIEKELSITNKIHLKKMLIHVRQLTSMHVAAATYFSLIRPKLKIAASFNTRLWLDDIGLLHYMNLFTSNCIDGYMLDQLTVEDLQHLKLSNELHVLSLKRGIQLLREIDYDLSFLIRRPAENTFSTILDNGSNSNLEVTCTVHPGEVCRWTQHQVMEWLRRIELPEYASNIRGSGIHGALIILEDRFNASSLASVLNIPQNRSLLRRHLQTKFQELIGPQILARKKKASENPDYCPVTITSKMKYHRKKSFFNVIKRKPSVEISEELLVPYTLKIEDLDLKLTQETSSVCNNTEKESLLNTVPLLTESSSNALLIE